MSSGVTIISGPPPANIRYGPRPNLILRYGDTGLNVYVTVEVVTLGPLYRDGPLGPPALPGLPMASYATATKSTIRHRNMIFLHLPVFFWPYF